jgi:hypothetical protein
MSLLAGPLHGRRREAAHACACRSSLLLAWTRRANRQQWFCSAQCGDKLVRPVSNASAI